MGCAGVDKKENAGGNDTPIGRKGGAVSLYADRVGSVSHSVPVAVIPSASHGSGVPSVGRLSRSPCRVSRSPVCLASPAVSLAARAVRLRRVDGLILFEISI